MELDGNPGVLEGKWICVPTCPLFYQGDAGITCNVSGQWEGIFNCWQCNQQSKIRYFTRACQHVILHKAVYDIFK